MIDNQTPEQVEIDRWCEKDQLAVERQAVIALMVVLFVAAFFVAGTAPSNTLQLFQEDFGKGFSPLLFAAIFLVGYFATPALLLKPVRRWKVSIRRWVYRACAFTLVVYTFPIGYVALKIGTGGLGAAIYILLFFIFVAHARAVYRS